MPVSRGHLIVPVGPPACGKSTIATALVNSGAIPATAIVSPDAFREMLTDERGCQDENASVFALSNAVIRTRLKRGLTVFHDATNYARLGIMDLLAADAQARITCIDLNDLPLDELLVRNARRSHPVPQHVLIDMQRACNEVQPSDYPGITINRVTATVTKGWL
jgi:predicted kinase